MFMCVRGGRWEVVGSAVVAFPPERLTLFLFSLCDRSAGAVIDENPNHDVDGDHSMNNTSHQTRSEPHKSTRRSTIETGNEIHQADHSFTDFGH